MRALTLDRFQPAAVPNDLDVLRTEMVFEDGKDALDHLCFEVVEREAGRAYHQHKVVKLAMLRYLPQEARSDAGLVARQRAALVGLYNSQARFDLVQVVAGIFDPPLGVVQMYGVATSEADRDEARRQADLGMAALKGVLANYAQARFQPLTVQVAAWLSGALTEMKNALVVIGHPDPRENARGGGRESPDEPGGKDRAGQSAYTQQQNELLFRGMSALREEFVWLLIAHRVHQAAVARMLAGIAGEASAWASRMAGTKGISFGLSVPIMLSGGIGRSAGTGFGESEGRTTGRSVADSEGTAHTEGEAETYGHSTSSGVSHATGVAHTSGGSSGVTRSSSWSVAESEGSSKGTADTHGASETWGEAHTEGSFSSSSSSHSSGVAVGSSWGVSEGSSVTQSAGESHGVTESTGVADGASESLSVGHGTTDTVSAGIADTQSSGASQAHSVEMGLSHNEGASVGFNTGAMSGQNVGVNAVGIGVGVSEGESVGAHHTNTSGDGSSMGMSFSGGSTQGAGHTASAGLSTAVSDSQTTTVGGSHVESSGVAESHGVNAGVAVSQMQSVSYGGSVVTSSSSGHSATSGSSSSDTTSHSRGESQAHTESQGTSEGVTRSRGGGVSVSSSSFSSTTHSESWGTFESETRSYARSTSQADTVSRGASRAAVSGASYATVLGRSLAASRSMGISGGVIPSVTASKSYQWVDDAAAQVAQLLRRQETMLEQASVEGAYLADVYMLTRSDTGRAAAEALVRQAFHGTEDVVTAVLTRRLAEAEQDYIRQHASAFTPSTRVETVPGLLEGYKDSTLLTMLMLAAYTAPGLYEQGVAVTVQERIPPFAFFPDMRGEVVLAHQWSTETGELTDAPVRLTEDRHMHTAFIGDTGFGKTVAAERLCVETALRWGHRNVVLDFGAGWRKLFHAPGVDKARVDVWGLYPGAVRPLRWNPLQIGKRIDPGQQLRATTELFANAGQMGPRQLGLLRRALREIYVQNGVLTTEREVQESATWGRVRQGEAEVIAAFRQERGWPPTMFLVGTPLAGLEATDRQALAIHRSQQVDVGDWYRKLQSYVPIYEEKRDSPTLTSLEGILLRLDTFTMGDMAAMYGKGADTRAIEDLGLLGPSDDPWGIAILEGGAALDEYAKASLLGLIAWHLYHDAIARRREVVSGGAGLPTMNIFWEEANKILSGVAGTVGNDDAGPAGVTELYQMMWRDGRKYGVFNHPLLQSVSEIAPGIFSSCNNLFVSQTKAIKDRDLVLAALAKSEKGFTDEEYKRFVSRMPRAMAICKMGYGWETFELEPMVVRPLMVKAPEPTDGQLAERYWAMRASGNDRDRDGR